MSYKKQEPSRTSEFIHSFLVGSMLLIFLVFCVVLLYVFMLWCPLRFPHKNDVRFVLFTLFVFVCVCVWWCPTHIVLCFCFDFFPSHVTCVASFSGLSIFDYPSVCSSIYKDNMSVEQSGSQWRRRVPSKNKVTWLSRHFWWKMTFNPSVKIRRFTINTYAWNQLKYTEYVYG